MVCGDGLFKPSLRGFQQNEQILDAPQQILDAPQKSVEAPQQILEALKFRKELVFWQGVPQSDEKKECNPLRELHPIIVETMW